MKLDKRDRQGVRTPAGLEQKYNFDDLIRAVERLETTLSQFIARTDKVLTAIQEANIVSESTDVESE